MKKTWVILAILCAAAGLFSPPAQAGGKELLGAGATFPFPFYSKLFDTYNQIKGVKVNYQSIGSGGGVQQIKAKTVDFGGTDAFMDEKEMAEAGAPLLHVPTCLGGVVITYNVPGDPAIKLTPSVIIDIFLGRIEKWNDKRILDLNPGANLPEMNIATVHRSDGSGTTAVFVDYLSKVSAEWKERVGSGKSVNWPNGLGGKGNSGVAGLVKQVPGAMGYVELIYAVQNKMPYADIKNKSGVFIKPSMKSISAAANFAIPDDTRVSIVDTPAKDGYPISGFTWLVFYKEQKYGGRSQERAADLVHLLAWILHDGQGIAESLDYAPLSADVVKKAETVLKSTTYDGAAIVQ